MVDHAEEKDGVPYKRNLIMVRAYHRTELENWGFYTTILGGDGKGRTYSAGNSFASRAEAEEAAVNYGKKIVDGEIVPKEPEE